MESAQPEFADGGRYEVQGHKAQGEDGAAQGAGDGDAGRARQRLSRAEHTRKAEGHDGKDALPQRGPRPDRGRRGDVAEPDGGAQDDPERATSAIAGADTDAGPKALASQRRITCCRTGGGIRAPGGCAGSCLHPWEC